MKILELLGFKNENRKRDELISVLRGATQRRESKEAVAHVAGSCCGSCGGQKTKQR